MYNFNNILCIADRFRLGQNVAVTWTLNHEPPSGESADFDRLTRAWFDEVRHFDPNHVEPFVFSKKLGHYTQVVRYLNYIVSFK